MLQETVKLTKSYSYGSYNKFNESEQWIRMTEGCPHNHSYCAEPTEIKVFGIPEIIRNKVKILDMNLLCKPQALDFIKELGSKRVNNKVVYYEFVCGIDYRFLTQEIANALKENRFKRMRMAWDFGMDQQYKIRDALKMLLKAGYRPNDIMFFMICNWKIPYKECCQKLDLCKVWNTKVDDCYFDNQLSPNIKPIWWTMGEIKTFRRKVRKHNQLVNFKIDPELKKLSKVS
ncbi:MAG: hypothetical protein KKB31_00800 [Nanoarchaeota archaeon]|nr:hypothetical protein [Nanoarchaeota archaeon]